MALAEKERQKKEKEELKERRKLEREQKRQRSKWLLNRRKRIQNVILLCINFNVFMLMSVGVRDELDLDVSCHIFDFSGNRSTTAWLSFYNSIHYR